MGKRSAKKVPDPDFGPGEISFEEFLAGVPGGKGAGGPFKAPKARGEALAAVGVAVGSNDFGPGFLARVEREEGSDAAWVLANLREGIDF